MRHSQQAFHDYQRQLWDPLSVPAGLDMIDPGYARGGEGVDSTRRDGYGRGGEDVCGLQGSGGNGRDGEWHFHVFGETVGLFALDVVESSAELQVMLGDFHYEIMHFRTGKTLSL